MRFPACRIANAIRSSENLDFFVIQTSEQTLARHHKARTELGPGFRFERKLPNQFQFDPGTSAIRREL